MEFKSYVNSNQELSEGAVFLLKNNGLEISIRRLDDRGDHLYLTCHLLNIINKALDTNDFTEAVKKAKDIIEKEINYLVSEFAKIKNDDIIQLVRY